MPLKTTTERHRHFAANDSTARHKNDYSMSPATFTEANCRFGPPSDLEESQCRSIPAFRGQAGSGSCDGIDVVVVAYQPTKEEAQVLMDGGLLYFTMVGGLTPHFPSLSFHDATHPA